MLLSQAAVAWALESWRGPVMDLSEADVSLSALPLAHSLGIFGSVLAPLLSGGSVAFLARFDPGDALAAIERRRVTVFPGVATMFRRILDTPALAGADLSSLRYALSGAAPCPWDLAQQWREKTGVRIVRGYGMTELFRPISYRAAEPADLPDAIGRAVPGVDLKAVDDDGKALESGGTGELWIRSPARMTGYLGRPGDTEAVFEGDWFRTGDLASLSVEGYVRIVGRKKDMILRGGYTVAPGEVEAVLMTHPDIAEAAVIGIPDDDLGEEIAAFVSLKRPGAADGRGHRRVLPRPHGGLQVPPPRPHRARPPQGPGRQGAEGKAQVLGVSVLSRSAFTHVSSPSWSAKADHPRVFLCRRTNKKQNVDGRPSPTMTWV